VASRGANFGSFVALAVFLLLVCGEGFLLISPLIKVKAKSPVVGQSVTASPTKVPYPVVFHEVRDTQMPAIVATVQATDIPEEKVSIMAPTITPQPVKWLYSYYWPDLGGVNCSQHLDDSGSCAALMASGKPWRAWVDRGVACPSEYPLGTRFRVLSPLQLYGEWTCVDRGGAIVCKDGACYLDFLHEPPQRVDWNSEITLEIIPSDWSYSK
jgi:hypothetical protein